MTPQWIEGDHELRESVGSWLAADRAGRAGPRTLLLSQNPHRRVVKLLPERPDSGRPSLLVKEFRSRACERGRTRALLDAIKRWIGRSPEEREWRAACHLHAAGLPVPAPLGFAVVDARTSVIVSEYIESQTLESVLDASPRGQRARLSRIGALVGRLHGAGAVHGDLHVGNILLGPDGPLLIDLQRVRFGRSRTDALRDLAALEFSLAHHGVSLSDRMHFRMAALGLGELRSEPARRRLREAGRAVEARALDYYRGRTRRCLRAGHEHPAVRLSEWSGLRLAELPEADVATAIASHEENVRERGPALLKCDHRSQVSAVEVAGRALIVKEVVKGSGRRLLADAWRGSPARRSWQAGHGLRARGIDAAQPLAYLEQRRLGLPVRSRVVLEDLRPARPVASLSPEAQGGPPSAALADFLCGLLLRLHLRGVAYPDLQAFHILAASQAGGDRGLGRCALIDLEGVRFGHPVADAARLQALAELNASLSDALLPAAQRRRIFERYVRALPFREGPDGALRKLVRKSRARRQLWRGEGCREETPGDDARP